MKDTFKHLMRHRNHQKKKQNFIKAITGKDTDLLKNCLAEITDISKTYPPFNRNILHLAIQNNLPKMVELILNHVRKHNIRIDLQKDSFGHTAFQLIAKHDSRQLEYLITQHFGKIQEAKKTIVKCEAKSLILAKSPSLYSYRDR